MLFFRFFSSYGNYSKEKIESTFKSLPYVPVTIVFFSDLLASIFIWKKECSNRNQTNDYKNFKRKLNKAILWVLILPFIFQFKDESIFAFFIYWTKLILDYYYPNENDRFDYGNMDVNI